MAQLGHVADLIQAGDGSYLAVGGTEWNGAVWRSHDGVTWRAAADVPPIGPQDAKSLAGVIRTAHGFLAWGGQGPRYSEPYLSVIWTSVDGDHWRETTVLSGFLIDVTVGGPGFIGVGSQAGLDNLNGALAWWSGDGVTWTQSAAVSPEGGMLDVQPFGGSYVAVGARRVSGGWLRGEVWHSLDGTAWSQAAGGTDLPAGLSSVVVNGGRLFAAASITVDPVNGDLQRPAIESSADGITWTQAFARECCGYASDIVAAGQELLASYRWYVPDGSTGEALLRSADGSQWSDTGAIELDPGVQWQHLRFVGGDLGLVGLGLRGTTSDNYQPVLLLPPASVISP